MQRIRSAKIARANRIESRRRVLERSRISNAQLQPVSVRSRKSRENGYCSVPFSRLATPRDKIEVINKRDERRTQELR